MLKSEQKLQSDTLLSLTANTSTESATEKKMKLDRLLRKPRSKQYMDAISRLDAGGHAHNSDKVKAITDALRHEFPEIELGGVFLGIVSKCYLGDNYEVHILDISGQIICHYRQGQSLPDGLEKARGIAIHGGYAFIEVYSDCCRAVSTNGNVSVI